ncbi:hypothetical protein ApNV_041 [Aratus pisonii nudivirus]|nr:hypothetical protein ApNV_041 [Aratus pisonii nudivirus]
MYKLVVTCYLLYLTAFTVSWPVLEESRYLFSPDQESRIMHNFSHFNSFNGDNNNRHLNFSNNKANIVNSNVSFDQLDSSVYFENSSSHTNNNNTSNDQQSDLNSTSNHENSEEEQSDLNSTSNHENSEEEQSVLPYNEPHNDSPVVSKMNYSSEPFNINIDNNLFFDKCSFKLERNGDDVTVKFLKNYMHDDHESHMKELSYVPEDNVEYLMKEMNQLLYEYSDKNKFNVCTSEVDFLKYQPIKITSPMVKLYTPIIPYNRVLSFTFRVIMVPLRLSNRLDLFNQTFTVCYDRSLGNLNMKVVDNRLDPKEKWNTYWISKNIPRLHTVSLDFGSPGFVLYPKFSIYFNQENVFDFARRGGSMLNYVEFDGLKNVNIRLCVPDNLNAECKQGIMLDNILYSDNPISNDIVSL